MIDEKRKQNGMKACFDRRVDNKVERELMRDPLIAYTRAFDDAIDWFKKALWHDVSEMPEKGKAFIFLAESNSSKHYHVGVVYNPMDYDKNCEWWGVIEWCYIEDLLPKGGEK